MASLTDSTITPTRGTPSQDILLVGSGATVQPGCLVGIDTTSGNVVDAANAATMRDVALCVGTKNEGLTLGATTGDGATLFAVLEYGHQVLLDLTSAAQDNQYLGSTVYVVYNHTVGIASDASHTLAAGTLMSFISQTDKTKGWVLLNRPAPVTAISV